MFRSARAITARIHVLGTHEGIAQPGTPRRPVPARTRRPRRCRPCPGASPVVATASASRSRRDPCARASPDPPRRHGSLRQRYRQRAVAAAEPQLEGLPRTVKCAIKGQPQVSWFVLHEVPNGSSFHPNHRPAEPAACGDERRSGMPAGERFPSVSEAAPTPMRSHRGPRTDREGMPQENWCSVTTRTPVLLPGRPGPCSASATAIQRGVLCPLTPTVRSPIASA